VARAYRVTEKELAAANQIHSSDSVEGVEALLVPTQPIAEPAAHQRLYTVRKGETLVTIADRFGVSLNELRRWNRIPGIKVTPGQRLRVAEPASATRTATNARRSDGSRAGAHPSQAAPAKGESTKHPSPSAHSKSAIANAKKTPAHRHSAASKKSASK
jgi:membrane-bound lytic murein transglycosylase D